MIKKTNNVFIPYSQYIKYYGRDKFNQNVSDKDKKDSYYYYKLNGKEKTFKTSIQIWDENITFIKRLKKYGYMSSQIINGCVNIFEEFEEFMYHAKEIYYSDSEVGRLLSEYEFLFRMSTVFFLKLFNIRKLDPITNKKIHNHFFNDSNWQIRFHAIYKYLKSRNRKELESDFDFLAN